MVLAPLVSVSVILTYYQIDGRLQEMTDTVAIEGRIIAEHLSHDSEHYMFTGDQLKLQLLIDEAVSQEVVSDIKIIDLNSNVVVTTGSLAEGARAAKKTSDSLIIIRPIIYKDIFVDEINQEVESLAVTVGWVHLTMSFQKIEEQKNRILFDSLLIFLVGFLLSCLVAYLISRKLFVPLKQLYDAVESISSGNLNTKLSIGQGGEFGEIENGINKMASELQLSNNQQKERVGEATQALMDMVMQLEQKNVLLDEARKEAEATGNAKVEFLANMSHEIRTPLNAVIGASDLLMKIIKDKEAGKYMSTLSVASLQLNRVVDDILDFSRMEANKLELEHVSLNILEVLENVISLHSPLAHEKKLELVLKMESGMPATVYGDPLRISQVVSNLVSNAIKFTEKGQVLVSASSVIINNKNVRLQINVKDTGAGLTESAQEKLFDAFSQADNAVARKFGGSGLGLAIVRKLIEQMHGFINVKSTVGKGTEFTVHLDLKIDKHKVDDHENTLSGMSVLLYEKNHVTEETIKNILLYWGVEVTVCITDDDFIGNLMKYKSDDKICDCIIMGMGQDALSTPTVEGCVKKIRYLSSMPVILMLNATEFELPELVIDEKVCWLPKPVNRQVLYKKLSSISNKETCIADQVLGSCDISSPVDVASLFSDLNILIAEDNTFNRDLLTDMLEAYGAKVVAVEDGQYAVEAALAGDFDIIFLDLHMPRKDGITAANEIKLAALEKAPFLVAATADVFIKDQGDEVDVFDSFVFKPIREQVLLEKLTILLNFQGEYNKDDTVDEDADNAFSEKLDREVRKLVLHIVEGSNNNDYPEIVNFSHQLLGVCGFYELSEMKTVAAGLERAAKEQRREDVILLIKILLKQLNISPDYKTIH
jgi:two-component system sensor histidine kinase BarA